MRKRAYQICTKLEGIGSFQSDRSKTDKDLDGLAYNLKKKNWLQGAGYVVTLLYVALVAQTQGWRRNLQVLNDCELRMPGVKHDF